MIFRKADKERLKRIETTLLVRVTSTDEWLATIAAQLKALSEGQDKLMQSHAALSAQLTEHDGYARDINVKVDAANAGVAERNDKTATAVKQYNEAAAEMVGLMKYVTSLLAQQELFLARPAKSAKQQRRKKAA